MAVSVTLSTEQRAALAAGEIPGGVPTGYYDGLIAKWPSMTGTQRQRIDAINALMITGAAITPAFVQGAQIYGLIDQGEWNAVTGVGGTPTTAQQQNQQTIDRITGLAQVDIAPQTRARRELNAIFTASGSPTTRTNLTNLYARFDAPQVLWWQSPQNPADLASGGGGLRTPVNTNDLTNAGLS